MTVHVYLVDSAVACKPTDIVVSDELKQEKRLVGSCGAESIDI